MLDAFHVVLHVTANVVEPAGVAGTFWLGGVTDRFEVEQEIKQKVISLVVVFSAIVVRGSLVLAPAHDFEFGIVASVNVVLLLVPGHGHPVELMVELELSIIPFAVVEVADIGYKP